MNNIKLAISNIAWDSGDDEHIYNLLKKNNITGLEIAPTRIFKESPYEQLEKGKIYSDMLKRRYNLDIISMQSIWFGKTQNIFENKKSEKELIEYTEKSIDFANSISCRNLVFGSPKNRNMNNYDVDYPKAVDFFKKIGNYAENMRVKISIEPNPVIYNTNFLNNTKQAVEFVKEVNLNSIKVNYDFGTVIYNEESLDDLKDNIKYINHVHISEPNLEPIKNRDIHKRLISILKESEYKGYVSIEMKKLNDIQNVINTIKYVSKIL